MKTNIRFLKASMPRPTRRRRCGEIATAFSSRLLARNREAVDEILLSGLLAQDKELASILHEVDAVSKDLKSAELDTQTISETMQRTVLYAIKRALVDRELRSLALKDDLTSLNNRRAFLALAGQQFRVARRNARGLLLCFADVDNLKQINDRYGHQEGDLCLLRVANALELTFRDSDVLARLGGCLLYTSDAADE